MGNSQDRTEGQNNKKTKRLSTRKSKGPRSFFGSTGGKKPRPTYDYHQEAVKEWEKQQDGVLSILLLGEKP